jgi:hypothetical protein
MVLLRVLDYVNHCYTNDDGDIIFVKIKKAFDDGEMVQISFDGVVSVSSSFVNSALIRLLDCYSFEYIKRHLIIKNSTKLINDIIRRRFDFETNRLVTN